MVKKRWMAALGLLVVLSAAWADSALDRARGMLDTWSAQKHRRLLALLFEEDRRFKTAEGYDMVKIAEVLKKNGLLSLRGGEASPVMTFESEGGNPLFLTRIAGEALRDAGWTGAMTRRALWDGRRYTWEVTSAHTAFPDPVLLARRLARYGARIVAIRRQESAGWYYGIDLSEAKMPALALKRGERKRVVRPVRPLWINVTGLGRLTIRELPGSHWYPDVTVYDKMLHILSVRQRDDRTRYMRLELPAGAAYVRIDDRFTLENLRSGVLLAGGGR